MKNQLVINASSINDLWFQTLYNILELDNDGNFKNAYPTGIIQQGSFMNEQSRLQFPSYAFCIENPTEDRLVRIPEGSNIPSPIEEEEAIKYFHNYIWGSEIQENETYTYGSRINIGLEYVMNLLKNTPVTNQAVIEIAQPSDTMNCIGKDGKLDPPCARLIDFKVIPCYVEGRLLNELSTLDLHVYFRSWDLYTGMPTNLFGMSMLQEAVSAYIGIPVGKLYGYSSGLHLYKYQKELAQMRTRLEAKEF